jgi:Zn-dependent oligopeptidase
LIEFYSEQVRKAKYDLDESQVKPYFELTTVLKKESFAKMYGITFKQRKDLPVITQMLLRTKFSIMTENQWQFII